MALYCTVRYYPVITLVIHFRFEFSRQIFFAKNSLHYAPARVARVDLLQVSPSRHVFLRHRHLSPSSSLQSTTNPLHRLSSSITKLPHCQPFFLFPLTFFMFDCCFHYNSSGGRRQFVCTNVDVMHCRRSPDFSESVFV
jgi:hypothetical protein